MMISRREMSFHDWISFAMMKPGFYFGMYRFLVCVFYVQFYFIVVLLFIYRATK